MTSPAGMACANAADAPAPRHLVARGARRFARAARVGWALGFCLVALVDAAPAEPTVGLSARLVCPRRPTPGRVVCEAELEVESGVLAWGDVLVLEAPAFAPPLRSRVGSNAAVMKSEQRQRLQLALAATTTGSGQLRVRARAVRCKDGTSHDCWPAVREARALVEVGPIIQ